MPQYTVNTSDGGQIVVNANSPQAALDNAGSPAGATVTPGAYTRPGSSGSGGGGGSSAPSGGGGGGGGGSPDLSALQAFFGQTAGFSRDDLAERARQFNANLELIEKQWEREGKPRLQIDQDAQALRKWQAEQDIALQKSQLGLNYLTTAAQLGGPSDYYQMSDFLRGARANTDVPQFLGALANNTSLPAFSGAGVTSPAPQTAEGLTARLTGAAAPTAYNPDQTLSMIGNVFKRGPTGVAPGTLEQLDPNELALLKSGAKKLGYDPASWLRAYSAAGIGQKAGSSF